jgi:outer membrane protein assembly factor BamD (BamD/ComL family)
MKNWLTLFVAVLLLSTQACQNSKHFTKLGQKQEAAGMFNEAADSYYSALWKKRANIDAQIGMRNTGQNVLNGKLNEFSQKSNFGNKKEAVYAYISARDYREKIKGVGVELQIPDYYLGDFEKVKKSYLNDLYEQGTKLLEDNQFAEAETNFNEIGRLDPNFKDAGELKDIAYLEPIYQKGVAELEAKHYRAAYNNFTKAEERKIGYKESTELRKECLNKGRYTIALLPFTNGTNMQGSDTKATAYILNALTQINDPFLHVIDRENLNNILAEQRIQLSGIFSESNAVEIGKISGAKALISGTVLNHSVQNGQLRKVTRNGFESYQVKKVNAEGKSFYDTEYKPVQFDEYYNFAESNVSIQYKMTSIETASLIKNDIFTEKKKDEVIYATYGGNTTNLYPANGNVVNMNYRDRNTLKDMLSARKNLRDGNDLANDLYIEIAKKIADNVKTQMQTLVP